MFAFPADEQRFFREKGLNHNPKRCKQCKSSGDRRVRIDSESGKPILLLPVVSIACNRPVHLPHVSETSILISPACV